MHCVRSMFLLLGFLAAQSWFVPRAEANSIFFDFGQTTTPAGQNVPLFTALFVDTAPNQVTLTVTSIGLSGNALVEGLFFNFNPVFNSANLVFSPTSTPGAVQATARAANDSFKAWAGGKFDIEVDLNNPAVFTPGSSFAFSITGINSLSVDDFGFLNTRAAGISQTYAAGRIQNLSGVTILNTSPQPVPVPDTASTLGLFALSLVGVGFAFRRANAAASA